MPVQFTTLKDYKDDEGNSLATGENVRFSSSTLSFKEKNSSVTIGRNVQINTCQIEIGRNSELFIGDECFLSGKLTVGLNSRIWIGGGLSVTKNLTARAVESTSIEIGEDCLFGSDIVIRTTDGHPVYDAATGQRINQSRSIKIGRHVWIADRAVVLKGVEIGNASVVGVGSVVTKSVGNNCITAGNPARVVRTGVTWERSPSIHTAEFYMADAEG